MLEQEQMGLDQNKLLLRRCCVNEISKVVVKENPQPEDDAGLNIPHSPTVPLSNEPFTVLSMQINFL
jgi:hypothetical protein